VAYLGVLLFVGVYLVWFYWNRARRIKEAGGADEFGQRIWRRQFGLADGERMLQYFNAEMYIGPLRPDVGPSTADRVLSAMVGQGYRGAVAAVALTDRDRMAIALEQGDDTTLESKVANYTGEGMGMDPLAIYANPKPSVRRGEQVFAGHPKYPATTQAPLRPGIDGRVARFHLLHIESLHAQPLTIWVEPLGAEALLSWSAQQAGRSAAPAVPQSMSWKTAE
jgi:hypothetical protein